MKSLGKIILVECFCWRWI